MHVADNVKRPVFVGAVVPKGPPFDSGGFNFLGTLHDENVPETLSFETPQRASKLRTLLGDDVRAELAIIPAPVSLVANGCGKVQHNAHRQTVILSGKLDQRPACL